MTSTGNLPIFHPSEKRKMRTAVSIRRAVEADVPALVDLAQRSWLSGNCELAPIQVVRDWMEADSESKRFPEIWPMVTVATIRSLILGLTSTDGHEVADLWVHPSFQRSGIGSILLQVAEEEIHRADHACARLRYTEYNVAAPRFYRANGYKEVSRSHDRLPGGILRDVIVVEKKLDC